MHAIDCRHLLQCISGKCSPRARGFAKLGMTALLTVAAGHGALAAPASASAVDATPHESCSRASDWPLGKLPAADAVHVDPRQFISASQLKMWGHELDRRGLRATGNAEHMAYIAALEARLRCAGVRDVHGENVTFRRWIPHHWALAIASGPAAGTPLKVASYGPYTGSTPARGVTAGVVYFAPGTPPTRIDVAGKIVLLPLPQVAIPYAYFRKVAIGIVDAGGIDASGAYTTPYLGKQAFAAALDKLQAAGAVGVIAIHPGAFATAQGTYLPFDRVYRHLPTLFVDRDTGARLKSLAATQGKVTLTLTASIETTTTRNIVGRIPGASNERVLLSSHTDGTNGLEDNGPDAIVGMAQYLARLPRTALPRTVMVMLDCCHFANGIGVRKFVGDMRKRGGLDRITFNLTLEHLGAQDWEPNAAGVLEDTGKPEPASFYLPPIQPLADAAFDALRNADAGPGIVMGPVHPEADGIHMKVWPGDGQNFWAFARIPTANYGTGPYYLLNWGMPMAGKIDYPRMRRDMVALTQMLLNLSRVPAAALRTLATHPITTRGDDAPKPLAPAH